MNTTTLVKAQDGAPATLSARLTRADTTSETRAHMQRLRRRIALPALIAAVLLALWSAAAPLSGAVIAAGRVQAEFGRKVVQHQEGGLLRELHVRTGQTVRRGDVLLVVGDLRHDAAFDLQRRQREAERLRIARAGAELAMGDTVAWPDDLDAGSADALQRERQLFDARRRLLNERIAGLQAQMAQVRSRITALAEQVDSAQRSAELQRAEAEVNRELVADGFVQTTRLMNLLRLAADADARTAAARAQAAEARGQLGSLGDAATQARSEYRQQAADELKQASARLSEIDERLRPTLDQFERQNVRAPVDGVVMALRVSAPGTAVGPREPLLEIAPSAESLLVETAIEPQDIDHVHAGGAAEVRLLAFDSRRTPLLPARVRSVSPDVLLGDAAEQRAPRYRAQVEVGADELARHPGLRLQAGMPVEVFITTPPRSLIDYLVEPLTVFARRALREP